MPSKIKFQNQGKRNLPKINISERTKRYIDAVGDIVEEVSDKVTQTNEDIANKSVKNFQKRYHSAWKENKEADTDISVARLQQKHIKEKIGKIGDTSSISERENLEKKLQDAEIKLNQFSQTLSLFSVV